MSELKYFNPSTNYNRLFNNEKYISQLIASIKKDLGRNLIATEKLYLINLLKNVNPVVFNTKHPQEIADIIKKKVLDEIKSQLYGPTDDVDIHEILKNEIGVGTEDTSASDDSLTTQVTNSFANQASISSFLGVSTIGDINKIINPSQIEKTSYILMDTRYRILDDDGTASFRWNFVNNNNTAQGTVNTINDVQNITSFKVLPFKIPYVSNGDNNYDLITMSIEEFSAQSYIGHENRKFHFIFSTEVKDRWIELDPTYNGNGVFKFASPITRIESLTLTFASPLQAIIFDTDRFNAHIYAYSDVNDIQKNTQIISSIPHNLETGDLVYISNFATTNVLIDSTIISSINDKNGITITKISDMIFSIDIDTTPLVTVYNSISVTNNSQIIIGINTRFLSLFSVGDSIRIISTSLGVTSIVTYTISAVTSDTQLILTTVYTGDTNANTGFYRNTAINNAPVSIYAGAKRVFVPLEITYNESLNS